MKTITTHMVFILDKSGSMCNLREDTIGSFNSMLKKQKTVEGEAYITTVLFNHSMEIIHNELDIREVSNITKKEYNTSGCTALLDALGKTLQQVTFSYKDKYKEDRPDNVIFVIITDGMENSSSKYSHKDIRRTIEKLKEEHNWEFLFLGANMDAVSEGTKLGIDVDRSVEYKSDKKGTRVSYNVVSDTIASFRTEMKINKNWKKEIEE